MQRNKKIAGVLSLALAVVIALGLGLHALATGGSLSPEEVGSLVDTTTDKSQVTSPIIEVSKKAMESIVGVNNYQTVRMGGNNYGFGSPYGRQPQESQQRTSAGSGTVISPYGHVLTNYHVVEGATRITINVGEEEMEATLAGSDASLDVAVLLVPGLDLPAVPLGDSDQLQVGEYAIVIGNPLGSEFARSVTVGFVSGVARTHSTTNTDRYGLRTRQDNSMIQIDAAISSGNSGGGMFNTLGQLQGIPTLKLLDGGTNLFSRNSYSIDNIGMCVPINAAKPLIRSVLESYNAEEAKAQASQEEAGEGNTDTSMLNKPRMGVTVSTLASNYLPVAQGMLPQGAYVVEVENNSPAQVAGLKPGDIIVEANGDVITHQSQLIDKIRQMNEGDKINLKAYRVEGLPQALEDSSKLSELGQGEYLDFTVELLILSNTGM